MFGKTMADALFWRFDKGMVNAMNAEISLGTVATVRDATSWLRYTYLFVRMQKNPFLHGELSLRDSNHDTYSSVEGYPIMIYGMIRR